VKAKVKVKLSDNKSWRLRGGMQCWTSTLTLIFGTTRTTELSALCTGRTLPPETLLGVHFRYMLSGPQGYSKRTEGQGHLKVSKDPHRKSSPGPLVLWRSASNNCGTTRLAMWPCVKPTTHVQLLTGGATLLLPQYTFTP
jgi:hypothetical protein